MLQRFGIRTLAVLLAATFCAALFCPIAAVSAASKAFRLSEGDLVIGADGDGLFVSVGDKRTTVSADTEIVIEGGSSATSNTILVKDNVTAKITLDRVRIEKTDFLTAPVTLSGAENVTLTLSGASSLSAPSYMAALQVNRYASLTLTGSGSLSATGGDSAAAVGGGWKSETPGAPSGSITIGGSVTITANGGEFGAGIGGGEGGASGPIHITDNAKVYARGGTRAAGIGSGSGARSRNITVDANATVEAAGGEGAAGIGSGFGGAASKISVAGESKLRVIGGEGAAALGCGKGGSATMVTVTGNATVRARGGKGAAAIGAGQDASLTVGASVSGFASVFCIGGEGGAGIGGSNETAGHLSISDSASVELYGGLGAAAFGSGRDGKVDSITLDSRCLVHATGGKGAAGIGSGENGGFGSISLSGFASVYALGGKQGAGIGGGRNADCGEVRIFESAIVTAQGGNHGAGIGTGAKDAPDFEPTAGYIYIYGDASVRAAGGADSAGVGGGLYASGGRVIVTDTAALDAYNDLEVTLDKATAETKADYSSVEAALAKVPKDLSLYTEESVKILEDAIAEINYDLPVSQQAQVDTYAASVERAVTVLIKKTVKRTVKTEKKTYQSGDGIVVSWEGATSPKDRIIVLKKGHLPTETEIDGELGIPYGTPLLSAYCTKKDKLAENGKVTLTLGENDILTLKGFAGLPAGKYTVYLCLETEDAPSALYNFTVKGTALLEADYSEVEAAIATLPKDKTLYTSESWKLVEDAINAVEYNLTAEDQEVIDGYAKAIRDAIANLQSTSGRETPPASATSAPRYATQFKNEPPYRITNAVAVQGEVFTPILLAQSVKAPESFGWGLISTQSLNVETAEKGSIVPSINYVPSAEDIELAKEEYDTFGIASSPIGAGAGCTMDGSFSISDTALFNGTLTSASITLEYGASIGTLSFDYVAGEEFLLPENVSCPGYIFRGWSTDNKGASPVSGSFTVSGDLTFYANWDVVPVSIDDSFAFSSAAIGMEYSDQIKLTEASTNFSVTLDAGSLPNGLTLDGESGSIVGTPTEPGTFNFTLLIVDANGTRTKKDYFITVYQTMELSFSFHTSANSHSATEGDLLFFYTYYDRGNGALKESEKINLSALFESQNKTAFQPESIDTVRLTVGAFVGEPVQLFFENTLPEDGYRIDKVVISSEGGDGSEPFEKTYQINAWIGNIDDANFFESGAFVVFLVLLFLLLGIVGVVIFLRIRSKRMRQTAKAQTEAKTEAKRAAVKRDVPPVNRRPKNGPF